MTREEAIGLGFKELPHFTVDHALIYELPRHRHLSIGSLGGPNEMLAICASSRDDHRDITDVVVLHNYDYDGYLTVDKFKTLIEWMG